MVPMARVVGIVIVVVSALVCAGLNTQAALRSAAAGTRPPAGVSPGQSTRGAGWPADLPQPIGAGLPVCLCNDTPATVTVLTFPDARHHRIPWGGSNYVLGRVSAFLAICHDPYWPYAYAVICPTGDQPQRIRLAELQVGRVPAGFALWRGRPDGRTGAITWFDKSGPAVERRRV